MNLHLLRLLAVGGLAAIAPALNATPQGAAPSGHTRVSGADIPSLIRNRRVVPSTIYDPPVDPIGETFGADHRWNASLQAYALKQLSGTWKIERDFVCVLPAQSAKFCRALWRNNMTGDISMPMIPAWSSRGGAIVVEIRALNADQVYEKPSGAPKAATPVEQAIRAPLLDPEKEAAFALKNGDNRLAGIASSWSRSFSVDGEPAWRPAGLTCRLPDGLKYKYGLEISDVIIPPQDRIYADTKLRYAAYNIYLLRRGLIESRYQCDIAH